MLELLTTEYHGDALDWRDDLSILGYLDLRNGRVVYSGHPKTGAFLRTLAAVADDRSVVTHEDGQPWLDALDWTLKPPYLWVSDAPEDIGSIPPFRPLEDFVAPARGRRR